MVCGSLSLSQPLSKTSLREEIILEEPDSRDSASFDMELDDLDPRVVEALLSLNRAIGMPIVVTPCLL
jgi:hypothetical protein